MIEPGYFATLGIPLIAGRDFSAADGASAPAVAIVSQSAARQFWPGQDPIGKSFLREAGGGSTTVSATVAMVVIGVARDAKYRNLREGPRAFLYVPLQQQYSPLMTIAARTTHGQRLAGDVRALVASMNPGLPIITAQTLEDLAEISLAPEQVAASASGGLGFVGLLLAAIGIYGVTAYAVTRRTREIGIRLALGAQRADVLSMVLRQGLRLAAIGTGVGVVLAAAISRLLTSWLFGLPPMDPLTFVGAATLFVTTGLVACYVPAYRATQIDAMTALRDE
jgi:predicted permease